MGGAGTLDLIEMLDSLRAVSTTNIQKTRHLR